MKLTLRLTPDRLRDLLFEFDGYRLEGHLSRSHYLEIQAHPDGRFFVALSEEQEKMLGRHVRREELYQRWESTSNERAEGDA